MPIRLVLAFLILAGGIGAACAEGLSPLVVVTTSGEHRFDVELADEPGERSRGLMFRRSMPQDRGMLFDFRTDQDVSMWMQNTHLSLDMIFIRADGTVARVARNTVPFSTDMIASGEEVRAVLELNAGTAERIALKRGDRVKHPIFQ